MLLKLYVFLLAIIGISAWQLRIEGATEKLSMKMGENYELGCHVLMEENESRMTLPEILWLKDGKKVPDKYIKERGASKEHSLFSAAIKFMNASIEDNGEYSCVAFLGGSKQLTVNIQVKAPAEFISTQLEYYPLEGSQAKISCDFDGYGDDVQMKWTKGDYEIKASSKYSLENEGRTLMISQFKPIDNGVYTCHLTQGNDTEYLDIKVVVFKPPYFVQFDSRAPKVAYEGRDYEFKCIAKGQPTPIVEWYKYDDGITMKSAHHVNHMNGTLILRNVTLRDAGYYKCVARSLHDEEAVRMLEITVRTKPKIITTNKEIIEKKGGNVTLTCEFRGEGQVHAQWIKSGESLGHSTFSNSTGIQKLHLELKDVGYDHLGAYICEVWNEAGNVSYTLQMNVHVPPKVTSKSAKLFVSPSTNVELNCDAKAFPEPTWIWYFTNGTHEKNLNNAEYAKVDATPGGGSKLTISKFLADHYGNYTCVARNANGNGNTSISVEKQIPPKKPSLKCIAGKNVDSLHCMDDNELSGTSAGSPRFYIIYYVEEKDAKDCCSNGKSLLNCTSHKEIEKSNEGGHVTIDSLNPESKYVVQAVAVNSAGKSEMSQCVWASTEEDDSTPSWLLLLYIIMALLALALLIDLLCCLTRGKGMIAALCRRLRRRSQDPAENKIVHEDREQNRILEETEVTYESNVVTSSNSGPDWRDYPNSFEMPPTM